MKWFYSSFFVLLIFSKSIYPQFSTDVSTIISNQFIYYVASDQNENIFYCSDQGFFKSTDLGETWQNLSSIVLHRFAISESSVFAGTNDSGKVVISVDGGVTWDQKYFFAAYRNIFDMKWGPNDRLWIGRENGIFYSDDYGSNWTAPMPNYFSKVSSICFDTHNNIYFADGNIFKSTDNGLTWNEINSDKDQWNEPVMFIDEQDRIYVCGHLKFGISSNGGVEWTKSSGPMLGVFASDNNGNMYAGGQNYVLRSNEVYETWFALGEDIGSVHSIAVTDSFVFFSDYLQLYKYDIFAPPNPGGGGSVYLPLNTGNTWFYWNSRKELPFLTKKVESEIIINNKTYYPFAGYGTLRYSVEENTLYQLDTDGFEEVYCDFDYKDYTLMKNPTYFSIQSYFATFFTTSSYSHLGSIETKGFGVSIYDFGESLIFADGLGIFGKRDFSYFGGSGGYTLIQAILIDSLGNETYYDHNNYPEFIINPVTAVADSILQMHFQVDHEFHRFKGTSDFYNFIEYVKLNGYYASTVDTITYQSVNAISNGLDGDFYLLTVLNLDLLKSGYNFYYQLESKDKGLIPHYSYTPSQFEYYELIYDSTIVSVKEELHPTDFILHQNYPNPFNPSTKIGFVIPSLPAGKAGGVSEGMPSAEGLSTLKVYDHLGREVATLINKYLSAGVHEVKFDGSNLSSGVYYYRLVYGDYVETKKMILLR